MRIEKSGEFFKVDDDGLAYGWAIVCTENGADYVDLQGDHIPEDVMVSAAIDFAANSRVGKDMHAGEKVGDVLFTYPVTKASSSLGLPTNKTGLLIGFRPSDPALLELVKSGARTGFSIGGTLTASDIVDKAIAKSATDSKPQKRTFRSFKIHEISLVDKPAMEGATVGYVKSAPVVIASRTDDESLAATKAAASLARALARVSPRKTAANKMAPQPENMMTLEEALAKIAELEAKLAELDKAKDGTEEVKPEAEIAALKAQIAELTKSAVSIDKSDPIAHTCADGTVIRKSDGALALKFAKQADEAILLATFEKAARERTELVKRATDMMGTLAGTHDEHADILKGVESTGNAKAVQSFTAIVNAATSAMKAASVAKGAGGEAIVNTGPQAEFDALVTKHAADHKVEPGAARLAVVKTEVGRALYGAIEQLKKSRAHG